MPHLADRRGEHAAFRGRCAGYSLLVLSHKMAPGVTRPPVPYRRVIQNCQLKMISQDKEEKVEANRP